VSCGSLPFMEALVPAEMTALIATDWFGCDGRKLIVQIRVTERRASDSETFEASQNAPKTLFGLDAKEDEMRMLVTRRDKRACGLDARMASLNGSLRGRQITTNESIDIRCVRFLRPYLRETRLVHLYSFHCWRNGETTHNKSTQFWADCQIGWPRR
jgi:hypothetical protein